MTKAIAGLGTLLQIGDGAGPPENFTTIAEVMDISGPELAADTEDVTSHDSPGKWEEHIATVLRSGTVSFDVNLVPTEPTHRDATGGLLDDLTNRTLRSFRLVFPDTGATTWSFKAYVTGFSPTAPVAGALRASVTLKLSGQPTLA